MDFVVFTGDLIHEGSDYDYELFDQIVNKYINVPYYYTLGNHDSKEAFYRGIQKKSKNDVSLKTKAFDEDFINRINILL